VRSAVVFAPSRERERGAASAGCRGVGVGRPSAMCQDLPGVYGFGHDRTSRRCGRDSCAGNPDHDRRHGPPSCAPLVATWERSSRGCSAPGRGCCVIRGSGHGPGWSPWCAQLGGAAPHHRSFMSSLPRVVSPSNTNVVASAPCSTTRFQSLGREFATPGLAIGTAV
jgi:hypothetical protein